MDVVDQIEVTKALRDVADALRHLTDTDGPTPPDTPLDTAGARPVALLVVLMASGEGVTVTRQGVIVSRGDG